MTVDIQTKDENDKKRIFEVLIDDPTIASLKHMAICTTKGSRGKLGLFKDEGKLCFGCRFTDFTEFYFTITDFERNH